MAGDAGEEGEARDTGDGGDWKERGWSITRNAGYVLPKCIADENSFKPQHYHTRSSGADGLGSGLTVIISVVVSDWDVADAARNAASFLAYRIKHSYCFVVLVCWI